MHNESFYYLDPNEIYGGTLADLTNSVLRAIKLRLHDNQFAHSPFLLFSSEVVEGIYHSFNIFSVDTDRQMGFYVDYAYENRKDMKYCEVTEVKVSLCL